MPWEQKWADHYSNNIFRALLTTSLSHRVVRSVGSLSAGLGLWVIGGRPGFLGVPFPSFRGRHLWVSWRRSVSSRGVGKLRHINVSSLWIQERKDRDDLELRKVLGTENPSDLMTKYLTRMAAYRCMGYLSQEGVAGRAKSGLKVQGGGEQEEDMENSAHPRVAVCFTLHETPAAQTCAHTCRFLNAAGNHPGTSLNRRLLCDRTPR